MNKKRIVSLILALTILFQSLSLPVYAIDRDQYDQRLAQRSIEYKEGIYQADLYRLDPEKIRLADPKKAYGLRIYWSWENVKEGFGYRIKLDDHIELAETFVEKNTYLDQANLAQSDFPYKNQFNSHNQEENKEDKIRQEGYLGQALDGNNLPALDVYYRNGYLDLVPLENVDSSFGDLFLAGVDILHLEDFYGEDVDPQIEKILKLEITEIPVTQMTEEENLAETQEENLESENTLGLFANPLFSRKQKNENTTLEINKQETEEQIEEKNLLEKAKDLFEIENQKPQIIDLDLEKIIDLKTESLERAYIIEENLEEEIKNENLLEENEENKDPQILNPDENNEIVLELPGEKETEEKDLPEENLEQTEEKETDNIIEETTLEENNAGEEKPIIEEANIIEENLYQEEDQPEEPIIQPIEDQEEIKRETESIFNQGPKEKSIIRRPEKTEEKSIIKKADQPLRTNSLFKKSPVERPEEKSAITKIEKTTDKTQLKETEIKPVEKTDLEKPLDQERPVEKLEEKETLPWTDLVPAEEVQGQEGDFPEEATVNGLTPIRDQYIKIKAEKGQELFLVDLDQEDPLLGQMTLDQTNNLRPLEEKITSYKADENGNLNIALAPGFYELLAEEDSYHIDLREKEEETFYAFDMTDYNIDRPLELLVDGEEITDPAYVLDLTATEDKVLKAAIAMRIAMDKLGIDELGKESIHNFQVSYRLKDSQIKAAYDLAKENTLEELEKMGQGENSGLEISAQELKAAIAIRIAMDNLIELAGTEELGEETIKNFQATYELTDEQIKTSYEFAKNHSLEELEKIAEEENLGLEIGDEIGPNDRQRAGEGLENKKFHIITRFDTSTAVGPIKKGQYFRIHLDNKLTVKEGTNLEPIKYNNEVIATPKYNSSDNTITYTITRDITGNIQVPLNIAVDYNTANIQLDEKGEFVVTNKVSGLGVKAPKDLLPQRVDKNGNLAGSIIEPDRKDVTEIISPDDSNYKIYTDAVANPVIKDGKLVGYNWTVKVTSDTDLDKLGYKANFTTVKGSGLGVINDVIINGSIGGLTDQLKNATGIVNSKHHSPTPGTRELTYNFFTPTKNKQDKYMMDISIVLTNKNKVGAKRIVIDEGWPIDKVKEATPNRVDMNNRTTIFGEFTSNSAAKWTVTDGVSTGDTGTKENPIDVKLPLETRSLGNQNFQDGQVAVYGLDAYGRMVQIGTTSTLSSVPSKGTNPTDNQAVGTIAVYEYNTTIPTDNKNPQSLGGVEISRYEDLKINQSWTLLEDQKMPSQTIKAVDPNTKDELAKVEVPASQNTDPIRTIVIPQVKVWDIGTFGVATKAQPELIQEDFPTTDTDQTGKTIRYFENNNYYLKETDEYYIHNGATVDENPTFASFTLIKKDKEGNPLPGATFKLLNGPQVVTDENGKALFSNIGPGRHILREIKAPKGYKINTDNIILYVDENGRLLKESGPGTLEVGANPTKTVAHGGYPDYMNTMHYGTIDENGNVVTYIYLKANAATHGGSTDRDTRLNIVSDGGEIKRLDDVQVYDVNPYYRDSLRTEMIQQGVNQDTINMIGNTNVLKSPNDIPIRASRRPRDPYTKELGYKITFPKERFTNDWGFLVVAKSTKDRNATSQTIHYDWLTDEDTSGQAKLTDQYITPNTAEDAKKDTTLTITNEAFQTRPVEVLKIDKDKKPIQGATFVIKDEAGNPITTVTSDAEGKASFGNLPEGKYIIEEIEAPAGYNKSNVIFNVTVDDSNQVTYEAKFKTGAGNPINGKDYWIEDEEQTQEDAKAGVKHVTQTLSIQEGEEGDIGKRPGVWEAYRLESLKYEATIDLENTAPGKRFSIQFDPNLDFTQYFGELPKLLIKGKEVADPYFDYSTNRLTYVFNENSAGGEGTAKINLRGIIPSKYFAQYDGTYDFTVTVEPGKDGITGQQTITQSVKANYEDYDYDPDARKTSQSYYFRDVYKGDDGEWYVTALAYYNPIYANEGKGDTLNFNWKSTNYQSGNYVNWKGNGKTPAFTLRDVKVYRTSPNIITQPIEGTEYNKKINKNMPLSFGIRPEQDPTTYRLLYSRSISPNQTITNDRQGNITLNYDPSKLNPFGTMRDKGPLNIQMPSVGPFTNYGYVVEQTFKIDDMNKFNNTWRAFNMSNGAFNSAFVTRANYNKAVGDQTGGEIPKFFSQKVGLFNYKFTPGKFSIEKVNELNNSEKLKGAKFSLTDEENNTIYRTTDDQGKIDFTNLKPGSYTLKEVQAPENYNKSDKTWTVDVSNEGNVTITEFSIGSTGKQISGDKITLEVTNQPVAQKFVVYKKDGDNRPLEGAEFNLSKKGEDGKFTDFATGTSNPQGVVNFDRDLSQGTYILEETKAPTGYKKLDKKWVVEVDATNKVKVYNYVEPSGTTDPEVNKSILGEAGTKWVNVGKRPLDGWILGDNRQTGYYNNYPVPYKLGTRIVAKNTDEKYVIQRYVINPEADTITLNNASIHREKPQFTNMDWYAGNGVYKIFQLDKAVEGKVEDIRLENYGLTEIKDVKASSQNISGQPRLYLDFNNRKITKPIVIDVKVPYTSEDGGVGTGMDLQTDKGLFWKSDYYDRAEQIVEGEPVQTSSEAGNIKGAYISDDSLDVTNTLDKKDFSFKKIRAGSTDAVSGATFKLIGPEPKKDERYAKSDANGNVKFRDLEPGVYKLIEEGAAQGYEKANTDWTITITRDGKTYIRDNNTEGSHGPKWQKVNELDKENSGRERESSSYDSNPYNAGKANKTYITEVDKSNKKFRQVFIVNKQRNYLDNPQLEIHFYPENRNLSEENTKILAIKEVGANSEPNKIENAGIDVPYTSKIETRRTKDGQDIDRFVINTTVNQSKTLMVEVESDLPESGPFGLGMDYKYRGTYWASEKYNSVDDVKLDPVPPSTVEKNATIVVKDGNPTGTNSLGPVRTMALRSAGLTQEFKVNPQSVTALALGENLSQATNLPGKILEEYMTEKQTLNLENQIQNGNTGLETGEKRVDPPARPGQANQGLEIGDEFVGTPVQATGWQEVDPNKSDKEKITESQGSQYIDSKVTEVNKDTKSYKQVFLLTNTSKKERKTLHFYLEANGNQYNMPKDAVTVLNVYKVGQGSTIDSIVGQKTPINFSQNPGPIYNLEAKMFITKDSITDPVLVEVEVNQYNNDGTIGLGAAYRKDGPTKPPVYFRKVYESESSINKETTYKVTPNVQENGTVTADPNQNIKAGQTVTLTLNPNNGFVLKTLEVNSTKGTVQTNKVNDNTYTFTMPESNVGVNVYFEKKQAETYSITVNQSQNGSVTADQQTAKANATVTLTVTPEDGYKLDSLSVTADNGQTVNVDSINYSFTMPASNVTVSASFKKVEDPKPETYDVTVTQPTEGGTIDARPKSAAKDVEITLTASPEKGYVLDKFTVTSNGQEIPVNGNKFKMPAGDVSVTATFKKSDDPLDSFDPDTTGDILIQDLENNINKDLEITNKTGGLGLKILKRDINDIPLEGAEFTIKKMTDGTYEKEDTDFTQLTGKSDANGDLVFKDKDGKEVKLEKGFYVLTETKAPVGFKELSADWKIEVKDDGGRIYAEYKGPQETTASLIEDNTKANAGKSFDNAGIKYYSRLTYLDPEARTFVQRIYVDTRGYTGSDQINVQITPKYKREEIDTPSKPPVTIKEGVKTAYRTTYEITNPEENEDVKNGKYDTILRSYDLSKKDMSMVNTARWRPFDWGFDEDQLNLGKGVYIIDVEGYYDTSIIDGVVTNEVKYDDNYNLLDENGQIISDKELFKTKDPAKKEPYKRTDIPEEDLGKIDLKIDFFDGKREFKQLKFDENGNPYYEAFLGASFQGGAKALTEAKNVTEYKAPGAKYANFVSRKITVDGKTYDTGIIDPSIDKNPTYTANTSVNLKPVYTSDKPTEIPKDGLVVENEREKFNITFSKHGRDDPNDDLNSQKVTDNRLEGAIFKLQKQVAGGYEDVPGSTVSSAFNGYFGFRGLEPGRYRLLEVRPPKDYAPLKGAVLQFTIAYEKGDIDKETGEITPGRGVITLEYDNANGIIQYAGKNAEGSGQLTDFVTSATAKNMGKIINNKPGKGKVVINKKDLDGKLVEGAKFKLTRTSLAKNTDGTTPEDASQIGEVGTDGKLIFEDLIIGNYELEEIKPGDGHQNIGQKWRFTVGGQGLDPYSEPIARTGKDLTDKISIESSKMEIIKPDKDPQTATANTIYPNSAHLLSFENDYKIEEGTVIKPGDYFQLDISKYTDLYGIYNKDLVSGLDIFADGIGTIAKAEYDDQNNVITYTFTEYANTYELTDFKNKLISHIDRFAFEPQNDKAVYQNVPVGFKMKGDQEGQYKNINVIFDAGTHSTPENVYRRYPNISSKITYFDYKTGEFEHIIYVNRDQMNIIDGTLRYTPGMDIENVSFNIYKVNYNYISPNYQYGNYYKNLILPPSYAVNINDFVNKGYISSFYNYYGEITKQDGYSYTFPYYWDSYNRVYRNFLSSDDTYIIRVTGKIKGEDKSFYEATTNLDRYNSHGTPYMGVERQDYVYGLQNENTASGKLEITAINPKNEINFKKVDQEGKPLEGAKFGLIKYDKNTNKWSETPVAGSVKTSGKDGLIHYEKLSPGKYALIEIEAPKGYKKIEEHIEEFTVEANGTITRLVEKPKEVKEETTEDSSVLAKAAEKIKSAAKAIAGETTEKVSQAAGTAPINVVNYKDIEFIKVDGENTETFLPGAIFEVWYKETEEEKYAPYKVKTTEDGKDVEKTKTVTSDKEGKFVINPSKPGYYALKEIKAPEGYAKMPGWIKEFKLENGKIKVLEKDLTKASHKTSAEGLLTSQIISVDKDKGTFKQRIIINPNHTEMTIPSYESYIRVKENDWKITPKYKENHTNGIGGEVNVALLEKDGDKTLENLTKDDFKKYDAISFQSAGGIVGSRYGLKEMLGETSTTDKPITTTDSIVMEFTGKLDDTNTTGIADQLFELVFDSQIDDSIEDKLDLSILAGDKPLYGDYDTTKPIQIENRKAEYPWTGGPGTVIFTLAGLSLMTAAAYVYRRKREVSYGE